MKKLLELEDLKIQSFDTSNLLEDNKKTVNVALDKLGKNNTNYFGAVRNEETYHCTEEPQYCAPTEYPGCPPVGTNNGCPPATVGCPTYFCPSPTDTCGDTTVPEYC